MSVSLSSAAEICSELCRRIPDPRQPVKRRYPLDEILFLCLCASCAGRVGWQDIHDFGVIHTDVLREYYPYEHGIPSGVTLLRVIALLPPESVEHTLSSAMSAAACPGATVSLDGKTCRASARPNTRPLHMLHACASETGLLVGYTLTDDKSNEITAAPSFLQTLALEGTVVTADALHAQRDTCAVIRDGGADYVIALKKNQSTLYTDVALMFADAENAAASVTHAETDAAHGRVETRETVTLAAGDYLQKTHQWPGLRSVIKHTSHVYNKASRTENTPYTRYFITSLAPDTPDIHARIRQHWQVEALHWQLDVVFRDDHVTVAIDNAAENLAGIRRYAFQLLKRYQHATGDKRSMKRIQAFCFAKPQCILNDILKT